MYECTKYHEVEGPDFSWRKAVQTAPQNAPFRNKIVDTNAPSIRVEAFSKNLGR